MTETEAYELLVKAEDRESRYLRVMNAVENPDPMLQRTLRQALEHAYEHARLAKVVRACRLPVAPKT